MYYMQFDAVFFLGIITYFKNYGMFACLSNEYTYFRSILCGFKRKLALSLNFRKSTNPFYNKHNIGRYYLVKRCPY